MVALLHGAIPIPVEFVPWSAKIIPRVLSFEASAVNRTPKNKHLGTAVPLGEKVGS